METGTYPWSEGHCVRKSGKWYFIDNDTGLQTFIENENMVIDSDHLEFLVTKQLKTRELVGLN